MPKAVDLIDKNFAKTTKNGNLMLYDDFMMNIFELLAKKIKPLKEYLTYMFEERQICPVGSQEEEDSVYPYDLLRSELYFPKLNDILQSNTFSALIYVDASYEFRDVFRDERKATEKYVSDIKGEKSMKKLSNAKRVAPRGIDASNSISESLHASSTVGLKVGGNIRLDHCAAEGQTRPKNDFGSRHALLVTGCKGKNGLVDKPIWFLILLQRSYKVLLF